jgi:uncharacterized membrane protein YqjE
LFAYALSLGATMLLIAGGHVAITMLFISVIVPRAERLPAMDLYAASYLVLGWGACWFLRLVRNALSLKSG